LLQAGEQIATVVMGLIAALSAIVALTTAFRLLVYKQETMTKAETELRQELKHLAEEMKELREVLNELTLVVKVALEKQSVINQVAADTMQAIAKRVERHDELIQKLQRACPLLPLDRLEE
jgi:membrane protein insertase Oxa1/YidC/SpoIIIJ